MRRRGVVLGLAAVALVLAGVAAVVLGPDRSGTGSTAAADLASNDRSSEETQPTIPIEDLEQAHGQFVVSCEFSHALQDDPIVVPGEPGASHRHDFFGNTGVDAFSQWDDLYEGETSCDQKLDTAAYWAPSLIAAGEPVQPLAADIYYRAAPGIDPATVRPYPAGLVMIGGDAAAEEPQDRHRVGWGCALRIADSATPRDCGDKALMNLRINFPDCWDGARTDTDNHHDHVAYSRNGECGEATPVSIPQLTMVIHYPRDTVVNDDLRLASGSVLTGHADFVNTWDQTKLEREVAYCINRNAVCGQPYSSLNGL